MDIGTACEEEQSRSSQALRRAQDLHGVTRERLQTALVREIDAWNRCAKDMRLRSDEISASVTERVSQRS